MKTLAEYTEGERRRLVCGLLDGRFAALAVVAGDIDDESLRHMDERGIVPLDADGALELLRYAAGRFGAGKIRGVLLAAPEMVPAGLVEEPGFTRIDGRREGEGVAHFLNRLTASAHLPVVVRFPRLPVDCAEEHWGRNVQLGQAAAVFGGALWLHKVDEIPDAEVTVSGVERSGPVAIEIRIFGDEMKDEYAGVFERRIFFWANMLDDVTAEHTSDGFFLHVGRRAARAGFNLAGFAAFLRAMLAESFGRLFSAVEVRVSFCSEAVGNISRLRKESAGVMRSPREGEVDNFYTCIICQSLRHDHLCVITPARPGACGLRFWRDCRIETQIDPTGPSRPISTGGSSSASPSSARAFADVDSAAVELSSGRIGKMRLHSLIDSPQPVAPLSEAIAFFLPVEVDGRQLHGIGVVARDFTGCTPVGLTFGEMLLRTGGEPGFTGVAEEYIAGGHFLAGDDGEARIVWMNSSLRDRLPGDFSVADERTAPDIESLARWLSSAGHPAVDLPPLAL